MKQVIDDYGTLLGLKNGFDAPACRLTIPVMVKRIVLCALIASLIALPLMAQSSASNKTGTPCWLYRIDQGENSVYLFGAPTAIAFSDRQHPVIQQGVRVLRRADVIMTERDNRGAARTEYQKELAAERPLKRRLPSTLYQDLISVLKKSETTRLNELFDDRKVDSVAAIYYDYLARSAYPYALSTLMVEHMRNQTNKRIVPLLSPGQDAAIINGLTPDRARSILRDYTGAFKKDGIKATIKPAIAAYKDCHYGKFRRARRSMLSEQSVQTLNAQRQVRAEIMAETIHRTLKSDPAQTHVAIVDPLLLVEPPNGLPKALSAYGYKTTRLSGP